jgi:N6-adenosine-specific RNA methylase IME4
MLGKGKTSSLNQLAIWTSLNVCRDHLNSNELALIAAELYRVRPTATNGKQLSQAQICQNLGVSPDTVDRIVKAQKIAKTQGPEAEAMVLERIQRGDSARQIGRDLEGEKIRQYNLKTYCDTNLKLSEELHQMGKTGVKFNFIYADPPWEEAVANLPYPTLKTGKEEDKPNQDGTYSTICSMADDVKAVTAKDAVLWLWTTSSLLQNGLRVMEAWGFKYVTMIVWAKSRANATKGAVKPKHELILVGKMRSKDGDEAGTDQDIVLVGKHDGGLGKPEHPIESVIELAARKLAHSEKPEEFAKLAEQLYPTQAKLELFARKKRDGWTTWGNQSDGKALAAAKQRSGGHQIQKSATAGMTQHRGRGRPRKQVVQVAQSRPEYEMSDEFNRTKNILTNPGI